MRARLMLALAACAVSGLAAVAQAPDITGKWSASFETQIGTQTYTYDLSVKDGTLTGTAKSNVGEAVLSDGKVTGDAVTFVEMLKFDGMEIRIDYKGKIVSADEIRFTRQVGDFATEALVAKRVK